MITIRNLRQLDEILASNLEYEDRNEPKYYVMIDVDDDLLSSVGLNRASVMRKIKAKTGLHHVSVIFSKPETAAKISIRENIQ